MISHEITLRSAEAADLSRLLALSERCPGAPQWAPHTWQQVLDSAAAGEQRLILIAESSSELVGFAVLGCAASAAEMESIAVSTSWRRRGVGRSLCKELLAWARARHARQVSLEVRVSNATARSLYVSLGFREAGIRPAYYRDPEEDALVMILEL